MTTSYTRTVSATTDSFPGSQATRPSHRPDLHIESFSAPQQIQEDFSTLERSSSHGYLDRLSETSQNSMGFGNPSTVRTVDSMHTFVPPFGNHAPFLPPDTSARQIQHSPHYLMPSSASFSASPPPDEQMSVHVSHSAPNLLALQMQSALRLSDVVEGAPTTYPGPSSFAHQIPQPTHIPPGFAAQITIADNLIGSILGRGGRTLNELQVLSNTRIRISQRGEYVP